MRCFTSFSNLRANFTIMEERNGKEHSLCGPLLHNSKVYLQLQANHLIASFFGSFKLCQKPYFLSYDHNTAVSLVNKGEIGTFVGFPVPC